MARMKPKSVPAREQVVPESAAPAEAIADGAHLINSNDAFSKHEALSNELISDLSTAVAKRQKGSSKSKAVVRLADSNVPRLCQLRDSLQEFSWRLHLVYQMEATQRERLIYHNGQLLTLLQTILFFDDQLSRPTGGTVKQNAGRSNYHETLIPLLELHHDISKSQQIIVDYLTRNQIAPFGTGKYDPSTGRACSNNQIDATNNKSVIERGTEGERTLWIVWSDGTWEYFGKLIVLAKILCDIDSYNHKNNIFKDSYGKYGIFNLLNRSRIVLSKGNLASLKRDFEKDKSDIKYSPAEKGLYTKVLTLLKDSNS